MIIRALRLRHGRLALPKCPSHPVSKSWHRCVTSASKPRSLQTTASPTSTTVESVTRKYEIRDPTSRVAQDFAFKEHQKEHTQHLGSTIAPHYKPHELLSNPPSPADITLELLMASQAHIGHATSLWHPANARYIFGVRGGHDPIHVISLDVTAAYLRRACKIVKGVTERGGLVLFVGTRQGQARTVVKAAQMSGGCHLFTKWIPGSITNGQQILGSCRMKVVDENDVEVLGFGDQLERKAVLKPDLVVCLNPLENYILLHECGLHNIPTIGIIDTDANPTWVTYPIPANDDSLRCVQVICGTLGRAGEEGQAIRLRNAKKGMISSLPSHGLEPPTEGQAEKEREVREREALIAQQVYEEEGQIIEDAWAVSEDSIASDVQETAMEEMDEDAMDSSLQADRADADYESGFQSYQRDRPLSPEELAQAPAPPSHLQDWEVEEGHTLDGENRS